MLSVVLLGLRIWVWSGSATFFLDILMGSIEAAVTVLEAVLHSLQL